MITSSLEISVPFHDIDIMHIAWHGHYLKYFELARTQLMSRHQLDWTDLKDLGIMMPIVDAQLRYRLPLRYGQSYQVSASIEEFTLPELRVHYRITDPSSQNCHAEGSTRQIYMDAAASKTLFSTPEVIIERLSL